MRARKTKRTRRRSQSGASGLRTAATAAHSGRREPDGWRLPSGEELAEFALHAGFVAPLLTPRLKAGAGELEETSPAGSPVGGCR